MLNKDENSSQYYSINDVLSRLERTNLNFLKNDPFSGNKNYRHFDMNKKILNENNFNVFISSFAEEQDFEKVVNSMNNPVWLYFYDENKTSFRFTTNLLKIFAAIRTDFSDLYLKKLEEFFMSVNYEVNNILDNNLLNLYVSNKHIKKLVNDSFLKNKNLEYYVVNKPDLTVKISKYNYDLIFLNKVYLMLKEKEIDFSIKPFNSIIKEDMLFGVENDFFNEKTILLLKKMNLLEGSKPVSVKQNGSIVRSNKSSLKINLNEICLIKTGRENKLLSNYGILIDFEKMELLLEKLNNRSLSNEKAIGKRCKLEESLLRKEMEAITKKIKNRI
ncbi:TPA: hypothetical protein NV714_003649 [Escherichia coli]|nr:hypothetical protein [Escherichia coli]